MKMKVAGLLALLLAFSGNTWAQVSFTALDIPATPGTSFEYLIEDDVTVDVGSAGANQTWDFSQVGLFSIQNENIVDPATSPFIGTFPNANRVTYGPVPFGLDDGPSWRYDLITMDQWTVQGISLYIEQLGGEFPFPFEIPLMPLPLEMDDTWGIQLYREVTIDVDMIPYPIPLLDEIRIEITIQGSNTCDAWGNVSLPGGDVDALRVFTNVGGYADAVGIYYLFGFPIEIDLGRVYELPVSLAYSWYSPGYGEVAFALSNSGETDPNFTEAASVRRMNLGPTPETIVLNAEPANSPVEIPAQGGTFDWSLGIVSTYQTPFTGVIWTTATLPNDVEYPLQTVPVNLPALVNVTVPNLSQGVPGYAPAGDYTLNVYAGPNQAQIIAHDSFGFSKLAAATADAGASRWNARGLDQIETTVAVSSEETVTTPTDFSLSAAFPNPFNPTTTLTLTLPEHAQVNAFVYDALGRQVATLAQGSYNAGQHALVFDGSQLASGMYFVSAAVDGQHTQMQKIVLMK